MSKRGAVARRVGVSAVGLVSPWTWPVRAVAVGSAVAQRRRSKRTRRVPIRAIAVATGVTGLAAAGVAAAVVVRARTRTPEPVAAHPPRVQDVPTAHDGNLPGTTDE